MKQKFTLLLLLLLSLAAFSQNANVCFNRLHHGYAEILIPVSEWQGTGVTLKVYHPNNNLVVSPITYNTADLTKVTNTAGQQYYYLKGVNNPYWDQTLTYEVSSPQDAAVSNTLAALPESQWSAAGTADVCGINKADVCFNRLHHGYAEMLIPVNQWQGTSVTLKVYHPNNNQAVYPTTYNTADLTKVTNASGQQYYYLKGINNPYWDQTLTYEVSSPQDAAVSNTLAALPESQWSAAGSADACGINKADVCFNRLHHGYAEMLIPVSQWQGTSVTLKVYHPNNNQAVYPTTYNTADLTKVTNASGQQYYYLKGISNPYWDQTLTYEVSSPQDAAVSNTLAALPESQWSAAGSADVCGINKADVCFNRLHHGYAEMLIPVSQWQGTSVTLKVYHPNNNQAVYPTTYNTADLTKVTNASGQQYYYLKGINNPYWDQTLTYEVSSPQDAAVSNTLAALPESQWSAAGSADVCGINKADVCFNRLHHGYAEMLIPVSQWQGTSVTLKVYHPNNNPAVNPVIYNTAELAKVSNASGQQYYYLKGGNNPYWDQTLTYEVSSPSDAAVSNTLAALPVSDWNDFTKQENCINKADGICINRNNAVYNIFVPVTQWAGNDIRVKLYHSSGTLIADQLFSNPATENHNGILCYKIAANFPQYANENLIVEVSSMSNAAVHMYLNPVQELCYGNSACTNPVTPSFTQIAPVCSGAAFSLPAVSNNGITGSWSPAINNTATTTYTFTPDAGQCANSATMTVTVNPVVTPAFTQIAPVCAGSSFTLPAASANGINGTWSPVVNNRATTTYTFTPDAGQCANTAAMTIQVNPVITPSFTQVQAISLGEQFTLPTTSNEGITGTWYPAINNQATTTYTFTPAAGQCANTVAMTVSVINWKLAPNSYVFDPNQQYDGLYIPVKKAYVMWRDGNYMKGTTIPAGTITADVLWEDNMGLIKSKENYTLDIVGTGESAEIKVPVNKVKKGNAVIAYKVNGEVFWSWHVWVTDDPTNGSAYKSYDDVKRELSNGTIETIPNSEWGWMDRNLGAVGNSLNGDGWNSNGGLMYQWGRKDPFPPLTNRDAGFYQVTGSMGKIVYEDATARLRFTNSPFNDYKSFNELRIFSNKSTANITDNIRTSVKNPLSLIYVNDDGTTTPSTYGTVSGVPYYYNWFGQVPGLQTSELSKVNLWSDNSLGIQAANIAVPQPYRNKSSYDPCPNGWRLPSALVASATKNVRMDFTPFGPKVNSPLSALNGVQSNVPPGLANLKTYLAGIKVYPLVGFDMTNVGGNNIGIFPGTGWIGRGISGDGRYHAKATFTDNHETYLWTATMTTFSGYSSVAGALRLIPDASQIANNYRPDAANYPDVYGLYSYKPADDYSTNNAQACRCIKDPLFVKNSYDFETKFFTETETYKAGLDNPNSYMITQSAADRVISIPVSKAFSVQSNYLGNTQILNPASFSDLKANVLWTDNTGLITQLTVDNPSSKDANINVKVNANKAGNAVVTLHNGSINNPVYWSWHIWVTNTAVNSLTYVNDTPVATDNYMNYTQYGTIMKTIIMDRNLGAIDVTPGSFDPAVTAQVTQLNNSQGLHYQWGRKDPLPVFNNIVGGTSYNIFLGTTNNGVVTYSTFTAANYNSSDVVNYDSYKSSINTSDKIDVRIEKILGYSAANPLKFMMPTVAYPTRSDITYILGSDWLFDPNYHGLYAERWGLGDKKSVFDPCPNGWRIPETGTSPVKSSPWSFKNNSEYIVYSGSAGQPVGNSEIGYYGSNIYSNLSSPWGNTAGFVFNNSLYNAGNYPKGYIRGKRSVMYTGPLSSINDSYAGGIWYANLHQNLTGRGTYMNFDKYSRVLIKNTDVDPYAAMSCRCVKQEDNGTPRGPLPGIPVTQNTGKQAENTFTKAIIEEKVKDDKLVLYPVPVTDVLNINAKDSKEYYYQIYSMGGQMVKAGKFVNKQTNISTLPAGTYLVRINDSKSVVKIIKQ